jgi:hypothetical protein
VTSEAKFFAIVFEGNSRAEFYDKEAGVSVLLAQQNGLRSHSIAVATNGTR